MASSGATVPGSQRRRAYLPVPPNALVGRDGELTALDRLLTAPDTRLLTLTGPPGVGKTRLAIAAAAAVAPRFADGLVFADLTAVRDPDLVVGEIVAALGRAGTGSDDGPEPLARALADRDLLLVLDNFEHVLDAAPALAVALGSCPRLRVLVTSREPLHLHAERELPVHPLALPGDEVDVSRFAAVPAVAMLARVHGFAPDFAVTTGNRGALAEICARLDGLPLALELAAARLKLFTPVELTFRLRHRMSLLTSAARDVPDRHRTLHAALAWSHDLLNPDERALFRRLSVFVGGWTLDAAQAVCAVPDIVETTASLVDKSLVRRRTRDGDIAEFVMLESLREYAAELLAEHGEVESARGRHARYFAEEAVRVEALAGSGREQLFLGDLGFDQGNLRDALAYTLASGQNLFALPLATALGWHAYARGRLGEALATLDRGLATAEAAGPAPDDALAGALVIAGAVAFAAGELDRADELLARGVAVAARAGDSRRVAIGTAFLGHLARARGRNGEAAAHHDRAGALHEDLGNMAGVAWSRYDLGLLARRRGDLAAAAASLQEGLGQFREMSYAWAVAFSAWALATVQLRRERADDAAALLIESLDSFESVDDGRGLAQCLEAAAAVVCGRSGGHRVAAELLAAAAALRERLAAPLPEEDRDERDAVTRHLGRVLGPEAVGRAREVGRALPLPVAVALARRALCGPAPVPALTPDGPLTRRERDVALLVAGGRTNRQIGRALGIAEKTTEVHVHNIIRKLGARVGPRSRRGWRPGNPYMVLPISPRRPTALQLGTPHRPTVQVSGEQRRRSLTPGPGELPRHRDQGSDQSRSFVTWFT